MRKSTKVLGIAGGLVAAVGIASAVAEGQYENDPQGNYTGLGKAGILSVNNAHSVNRNVGTSINSIFSDSNGRNAYAIDPVLGLTNIVEWLRSDEAKTRYTELNRQGHIKSFEKLLSEINNDAEQRGGNYGRSLARLSEAVEDGVIYPQELKEVENGVYMIILKGAGGTVPALVKVGGLEREAESGVVSTTASPESSKPDYVTPLPPESASRSAGKPEGVAPLPPDASTEPGPGPAETLEKKAYTDFIFGPYADANKFGLNMGFGFNFPVNDGKSYMGFDAQGHLTIMPGRSILDTMTAISEKGIYSHISKKELGPGFGVSGGFMVGPLGFRVGTFYNMYDINSSVQGMQNDSPFINPATKEAVEPIEGTEKNNYWSWFAELAFKIDKLHEDLGLVPTIRVGNSKENEWEVGASVNLAARMTPVSNNLRTTDEGRPTQR